MWVCSAFRAGAGSMRRASPSAVLILIMPATDRRTGATGTCQAQPAAALRLRRPTPGTPGLGCTAPPLTSRSSSSCRSLMLRLPSGLGGSAWATAQAGRQRPATARKGGHHRARVQRQRRFWGEGGNTRRDVSGTLPLSGPPGKRGASEVGDGVAGSLSAPQRCNAAHGPTNSANSERRGRLADGLAHRAFSLCSSAAGRRALHRAPHAGAAAASRASSAAFVAPTSRDSSGKKKGPSVGRVKAWRAMRLRGGRVGLERLLYDADVAESRWAVGSRSRTLAGSGAGGRTPSLCTQARPSNQERANHERGTALYQL